MSATAADADGQRSLAEKLGFASDEVVLELGYDDDCDEGLRAAIEVVIGSSMLDEDNDEIVDTVVLWWREDDGDLVDALVDALSSLGSGGVIWLLTPKAGRDGHIEPSDIGEAAPTAGLSATKSTSAAADWSGTRLVAPKVTRR
ncbi:MAG: DUF3052 domain-containing protein [Actinomycetes bacterium]